MASTTEIGDSFRDTVCDLLRTQYPDAKAEQYVNGTKVDVLFTRIDWGRQDRMAVECKNYGSPLTKTYIEEKIFPKYQMLLNSRHIDGVLIVSRKAIGSAASDVIRGWHQARHLTIQELEESLLGIRKYVETLAVLQPIEEAPYVEARFDGQEGNALSQLEQWVSSPGANGLAILGSYGQGKTSLTRRVSGFYANAYLADPTRRIPILKKLGEVVHETRLEALFGAEFTADSPAPGYQFKTFEHLNRIGRLLIILDGFDEMKHAMTASDFLSNFREFNRLLRGHSKVILLGRPNALSSDSQELVFRGIRKVGDTTVASTEFAEWKQWTLAFFNDQESKSLLLTSLHSIVEKYKAQGRFQYAEAFVEARAEEVLGRVPKDLLARPVHVQLIAELAADPSFDFVGFNRYRLYEHFIRSMVQRDTTEKRARMAIALEHRLQFQQALAWWAWKRIGKVQGSFDREEIPDSLLADFPDGNPIDLEGKRNEYIVSTLTEEKDSGVLYFAHRSFQEFLVAEKIRTAKPDPNAHAEYAAHITPDIISFLKQAPDLGYVLEWYDTLRSSPGQITTGYLEFFASFPHVSSYIRNNTLADIEHVDMWTVSIAVFASKAKVDGALDAAELNSFLHKVLRHGQDDPAAMAVLALLIAQQSLNSPMLLTSLVGGLIERCLRRARPESDAAALSIEAKNFDFAAKWLGHTVERVLPSSGQLDAAKLHFDTAKLFALSVGEVNARMSEAGTAFGELRARSATPVSVEVEKAIASIDGTLRKAHLSYLKNKRPNFVVASVDKSRKIPAYPRERDRP